MKTDIKVIKDILEKIENSESMFIPATDLMSQFEDKVSFTNHYFSIAEAGLICNNSGDSSRLDGLGINTKSLKAENSIFNEPIRLSSKGMLVLGKLNDDTAMKKLMDAIERGIPLATAVTSILGLM